MRGKKQARAARSGTRPPAARRPRPTASPSAQPSEGERRHLTVMFCDLVDSTAISARLDPEDLRLVIDNYQRACGEMIERYEGHIARYLGDGVLAYCGYPHAHEDDGGRAAHAALDIVTAIAAVSERSVQEHGVELAVRIGIHTGLVVAGGGARPAQGGPSAPLRSTPHLPAPPHTPAPPGPPP